LLQGKLFTADVSPEQDGHTQAFMALSLKQVESELANALDVACQVLVVDGGNFTETLHCQ